MRVVLKLVYAVGRILAKIRASYLQGFYSVHLRIRGLHDQAYRKFRWYKRYTDTSYTSAVHRTVLIAFVFSFFFFSIFQLIVPQMFLRPSVVQAGSNSKTWTTRGDFSGGTPDSNIALSGVNPADDSAVSLVYQMAFSGNDLVKTNVPAARNNHTAIWTGTKMIVWGGSNNAAVFNTGGTYDPATDSWTAISTTNAPTARQYHTAVWTGTKMIVWGGSNFNGTIAYGSGGTYDPATDSWTAISTTNAPTARQYHTAVWTGTKMIVWGGSGYGTGTFNTGSIYDPATDSWTAISTTNAPTARQYHTAIWTGAKMIVWGGYGASSYNTGSIYDPATDSWTAISTTNAPTARQYHTAIWTGAKMIVWGGSDGTNYLGGGGIYNPTTDSWTVMTATNAPAARRYHVSVWTGTKMIVWGGNNGTTIFNTGGIYDPDSDSWVTASVTGAPTARSWHSGIWTGNKMIVWGGFDGTNPLGNGGIFASIFTSPGTLSSLKIDAGTDKKAKWSNLSWNATTPANTSVKFNARTSNDNTVWSAWSADLITATGSSLSALASTRFVEFQMTLTTTDGVSTPTLNDFTVSYDSLETPTQASLVMQKTDGSTIYTASGNALLLGTYGGLGYTNETAIKITANNLTCTGCATAATNLRPQVEIQPVGTAFTGTPTTTAASGTVYTITTGLTAGTGYHIQVRATDDQGRASAWISYGGNAETEADFTIDQTAPTGTTVINAGATYATSTAVTLTNSATDTGGSALAQMRFSNDGTTWSVWEPYNTTKAWNLTTGDGAKTVFVQYNDWAGNTSGQIKDNSFGGTTSNISAIGGQLALSGVPTNISGDTSDGEVYGDMNGYSAITNGASVQVYWDSYSGSDGYLRINGLPTAPVLSATLKIYSPTAGSSGGVLLCPIVDYGSLTASTVNIGCSYGAIGVIGTTIGWNNIDVTSWVNNFIAQSRSVIAFRIYLTGISANNFYFSTYESGTTKPVITYSGTQAPYSNSGTYTSTVFDSTVSGARYGNFVAAENKPVNTTLTYQVRGGNTATPDASWTAYAAVANKAAIPVGVQGLRYIQYQAVFSTTDTNLSPVLDDVFIGVDNTSQDTITLDTAPPAAVTGLAAYSNSTKTTALTAGTWYTHTAPYFSWTANTEADLAGYKYCFELNNACIPTTSLGTATNYNSAALTNNGSYYFRIVAFDNAGNSSVVASFNYNFDNTIPSPVTGFTASDNDLSKINLSWNPKNETAAPVENYKLERVRYSDYTNNVWNLSSNWSTGTGYAIFTLTTVGFSDDSVTATQGQPLIQTSVKYIYRIRVKDVSNASYSDPQLSEVYGLTRDSIAPSDPSTVTAVACDGTVTNCSNIANKGFEIKLSWNPSTDTGTGVAKYNIFRATASPDQIASFMKIGEVTYPNNTFYDNDAAHLIVADRLNDFTVYYYRVTAVDAAVPSNESALLPSFNPFSNSGSAKTPDVTAPSTPLSVSSTPMGLDPSGTKQRIKISWAASNDLKSRSTENGSGVSGYRIYRDTSSTGTFATLVGSTANLSIDDDGLSDFTIYYYKVESFDLASPANVSPRSDASSSRTASSAVPTVPTTVSVITTKGNPLTNGTVGHASTVSFKGSYAKNCLNSTRCLTKYELYRSTNNFVLDADWIAQGTKVRELTPTRQDDDRDSSYSFSDSGLSDATTYYYKVRALDNTPAVPDGGAFYSGLSAVSVGILNSGWDTTPDVTAPNLPIALKVKDIHDDGVNYKRNIVTWARIATPTRSGANDFREYRIYRSNDGLAWSQILVNGNNPLYDPNKEIALATNYYIDLIPNALANQVYYYFVTAVDDAGSGFKYSNGQIINSFSNESQPAKDINGTIISVSLNPAIANPSILVIGTGTYAGKKVSLGGIGVSSATISWTTDQAADSLIEYRKKNTSDPFITVGTRSMGINHSVRVFGLMPSTEYEYRAISRNILANDAIAEGVDVPQFITSGFNISDIVVKTTTSTVEIAWGTNLDAKSNFIEYQLQKLPGDSPQEGIAGELGNENPRLHRVVIKGLRSGRTYTYKIKSISMDDFISETEFRNFKTQSFDSEQFVIAPNSSNVAERNITATSAQIIWSTAIPTTSWVDYGSASGKYDYSAGDNNLNTNHFVKLENLASGTTYYYKVRVKDVNEVEYTSQEYSFRAIAKPRISNIRIKDVTPYSITIAWETNVPTDTLVNWGTTKSYGERRGKSEKVNNHELRIDNLLDDTEYHYQIVSRDEYGNEVVDDDKALRTPLDKEGPKIISVKTDVMPLSENDDRAQVIISFETNKPATTLIQYDEGVIGGKYSLTTIKDAGLNISHTVIIKDLNPATTYHFRVVTEDRRKNQTISNDYTFITPTKEKSILQLILKALEETFSWTKNVGQYFSSIRRKAAK